MDRLHRPRGQPHPGQTRGTLDAVAVAGFGLDQAGIDGKALAADQPLIDVVLKRRIEQTPQSVTIAKAP